MGTGRLEAFSDGVLAIIITIMVLELKVPHGADLAALRPMVPVFCSYVVSFVYVGIYWNNHHHMMHATEHVSGGALWANLHLLFWLSLIPATTSWVGENPTAEWPTAVYGIVLFMAGVAYFIMARLLVAVEGPDSKLARAIGDDTKGQISAGLYAIAVGLAFFRTWLADAIYVFVAILWLIPDSRIEKQVRSAK